MNQQNNNVTSKKYEEMIITAFTKLLETNSFDQITIQQITDEAEISRQTFYRHFNSKDDILELFSNQLTAELSKQLNELYEKNIFNIFLCYFTFWMDNSYLLDLVKKSSGVFLLNHYYNQTMQNVLDILKPLLPNYTENEFDLVKSFLIGGLYQMKMMWSENSYKETPQKLAQLVTGLLN